MSELENATPDVCLVRLAEIRDIRTKTSSVNKAKRTLEALVSEAQTKSSRLAECQQELELLAEEKRQAEKHLQQIEEDARTLKACMERETRERTLMLSRARFVLEDSYKDGRRDLDSMRDALGLPPACNLDIKGEYLSLVMTAPPYEALSDEPRTSVPNIAERPTKKRRAYKKRK